MLRAVPNKTGGVVLMLMVFLLFWVLGFKKRFRSVGVSSSIFSVFWAACFFALF
ncbi:MAG: hypothetical protein FD143_2923 [Ignavibacteria bacterium]|nr:MAG: hypothetical protein FD143_2923 [Ignavibacteria bacterium]